MNEQGTFSRAARLLVLLAMFVIVVAGMKAAASLLVPFLLAIFLALLCLPPVQWLQSKRLPGWASVVIVFIAFFLLGGGLLLVVGGSIQEFGDKLPEYSDSFEAKEEVLRGKVSELFGVPVKERQDINSILDGDKMAAIARAALGQVSSLLGNLVMVLLLFVFLLAELQSLPAKIAAMRSEGAEDTGQFQRIVKDVNRYVFIKSVVSFATGGCAAAACAVVGVDFPILWGMLAFIMNFVPNIGSFMAAIPAILVAFVQPGLDLADVGILAGCYVAINFFFGNFVEPRMMGRSLDLSTLVVFVSMVFWGWVFGAVGMLLSVPLTMVIKIACENSTTTRPIAILLGSAPEPEPESEPKPETPA